MTAPEALKPLIAGSIDAPVLVLDAPISFWGGVDYETGRIIDQSHPQTGELVGGRCLVVPNIRGSGGTPGNLADTLRRGCGPAGIVIGYPDINVMTGIVVAQKLYGTACPMFLADDAQRAAFTTGARVVIGQDGTVSPQQASQPAP